MKVSLNVSSPDLTEPYTFYCYPTSLGLLRFARFDVRPEGYTTERLDARRTVGTLGCKGSK